jgi:hypothetical protein
LRIGSGSNRAVNSDNYVPPSWFDVGI